VGILLGGVATGLDDFTNGVAGGEIAGFPRGSTGITYSSSKKQLSKQLPSQKLKHCLKSEFHFKPNLMQS